MKKDIVYERTMLKQGAEALAKAVGTEAEDSVIQALARTVNERLADLYGIQPNEAAKDAEALTRVFNAVLDDMYDRGAFDPESNDADRETEEFLEEMKAKYRKETP